MRFEHGSHRTECLAALIVLLLLCHCCRCCHCSSSADCGSSSPFGTDQSRQCLPLLEGLKPSDVCGDRGRNVRLRFCDFYEPAKLFSNRSADWTTCDARALDKLRRLDDEARRAATLFRKLIDRYDCENANSVSWTCKDCEVSTTNTCNASSTEKPKFPFPPFLQASAVSSGPRSPRNS